MVPMSGIPRPPSVVAPMELCRDTCSEANLPQQGDRFGQQSLKIRQGLHADSTILGKRLILPRPLLMSIRLQTFSAFVLRHLEASLLLQIAHIMASRFSRKTAKLRTAVEPVKDNRAARFASIADPNQSKFRGIIPPLSQLSYRRPWNRPA